jgi:hypothetical protein
MLKILQLTLRKSLNNSIMNKQLLLKSLLITQTITILCYTFFSFQREGANLFQIFVANITALNWSGQFNLDFSCYLTLSGLWIMWRNKFNSNSILFGIVAMILGIMAFAPYLLYLLTIEKGDLKKVVIGNK